MENINSIFYVVLAQNGFKIKILLSSFTKKRCLDLKYYLEKKLDFPSKNQIIMLENGKYLQDDDFLEAFLKEHCRFFVFNKDYDEIEFYTTKDESLKEEKKKKIDFLDRFKKYFKGKGLERIFSVLEEPLGSLQSLFIQINEQAEEAKRLLKETKLQNSSEITVLNSLEQFFTHSKNEYNKHLKIFSEKNNIYKENLYNIDIFYQKLLEYELDDVFRNDNMKNLKDFFNENDILNWKINFEKLQGEFENNLNEKNNEITSFMNKKINNEIKRKINPNKLEDISMEIKKITLQLKKYLEELFPKIETTKDYKTFFQNENLYLKEIIPKINLSLEYIQKFKKENVMLLKETINKVAEFQDLIIEKFWETLKNMSLLENELEKKSSYFLFIKNFPHFYENALEEYNRRLKINIHLLSNINDIENLIIHDKQKRDEFISDSFLKGNETLAKKTMNNLFNESKLIEKHIKIIKEFIEKEIPNNSKYILNKEENCILLKKEQQEKIIELEKKIEEISQENENLTQKNKENEIIIFEKNNKIINLEANLSSNEIIFEEYKEKIKKFKLLNDDLNIKLQNKAKIETDLSSYQIIIEKYKEKIKKLTLLNDDFNIKLNSYQKDTERLNETIIYLQNEESKQQEKNIKSTLNEEKKKKLLFFELEQILIKVLEPWENKINFFLDKVYLTTKKIEIIGQNIKILKGLKPYHNIKKIEEEIFKLQKNKKLIEEENLKLYNEKDKFHEKEKEIKSKITIIDFNPIIGENIIFAPYKIKRNNKNIYGHHLLAVSQTNLNQLNIKYLAKFKENIAFKNLNKKSLYYGTVLDITQSDQLIEWISKDIEKESICFIDINDIHELYY